MSLSRKIQWTALLIVFTTVPAWAQGTPAPAPEAPPAPEALEAPPAPEAPEAPTAVETPPTPASAMLTEQERDQTALLLETTLDETLARVESLSDEAWNWKPAEDRWSIAEVVEHLVLVEDVFATLDEALAEPANDNWQVETAGKIMPIYSFMPDRSRKVKAPEFAVPQGGKDRGEMLGALKASRKAWTARLQDPDVAFKAHTAPHPAFGTLNVHQWVLFIGLHHLRHNLQVVEVMAEPAFPH